MSIISLCTGYGGLDEAVQEVTGLDVAVYAEIMPEASSVLNLLYPNLVNLGDITKSDWEKVKSDYPGVTVVCAGFPCQNISDAGNREGIHGEKSKVWFDVLSAVRVLRPHFLFLENVDAIRTNGLDEVSAGLNDAGYTLVWMVMRASSVGAPHQRDRWFGIAAPSDNPMSVEIPRVSNDVTPKGVFGTPMVRSSCGPGDMFNYKNQSRLETQTVTDPDNPYWVDRRPAIAQWEAITGRAAPSMTETSPESKVKKRVSSRFIEWMMGVKDGLVTSPDVGLNRDGQIKVLGGGVVPLQAVSSYRVLMENLEVMMPLSEAAKELFDWDENSPHAPMTTEVEGTNFRTPCRCGYPGRTVSSSPSHSYNSTRVHVTNENQREAEGGAKVAAADYTTSGQPPRARARTAPGRGPAVPRSRSQGTPGTPCGCGCGEPSGGLFRPGHDSKLLSRLLGEIRSGAKTLTDAHAEMTTIGTSEVLKEKLAKKVG